MKKKTATTQKILSVLLTISIIFSIFTVSFSALANAAEDIQTVVTDYGELWTGDITVKTGSTVKWYVNVPDDVTPKGCGATIKIPGLGWGTDTHNKEEGHLTLTQGSNFVYEFTPTEAGDILFTCWMGSGCHHNYIHVTDSGSAASDKTEKALDGVLICGNCKSAPPAIHTTGCTLMTSCKASGYGLIVPQADKTYKFYKFDSEGDERAYSVLSELKEKGVAEYLSVKVSGTVNNESGKYSYSYTNKSGTEITEEYDYDGTITDISSIAYDETHAGFEAYAAPINSEGVRISEIPDQKYTGEAIAPDVVITDGSYILKPRIDYLAEYSDNTEAGTANITIKGIGAFYKGEAKATFNIVSDKLNPTEPTKPLAPAAPKLKTTSASLKAGKTSVITVLNSGSSKVGYKSSNKKVAVVKNGKVIALKKGSADITVTVGKKKLTYKVTVTSSPKLKTASIKVKKGSTKSVKIIGKASTEKNKYTNTKFAKITSKVTASNIKISGLQKGKTTLKIRVNGVILKLKVYVK